MTNSHTHGDIIDSLCIAIKYHHKALDSCTIQFPYYRDIKSSLAESYAQLAHEYYRLRDLDKALDFYKKAIDNNHYHFQARNQIGYIYFLRKDYNNAINSFEEIIYLAKENHEIIHKVDALLSLGQIFCEQNIKGSINKAYKYVLEAEKIAPEDSRIPTVMQLIMNTETNLNKPRLTFQNQKSSKYFMESSIFNNKKQEPSSNQSTEENSTLLIL